MDLLFTHNALDTNKDYFQVIYYLLKNISSPEKNTKAALLVYIIKSLQKHIEILKYTQHESKTAQIIPQKLLKLLYKQIQTIDFTKNPILRKKVQIFKKMQSELLQNFRELIPKHKQINPQDHIINMLNNDYISTFEDFLSHLKYFNTNLLNSLLRTSVTDVEDKI